MMENLEKGTGLLGKVLSLQKKYGFFSILKSLIILLLLGYIVFFVTNPTYLLKKIETIQEEYHKEAITDRINADSEVKLLLEKLLLHTEADRTWLVEMHNGSSNLGTGLPFLFGSMRMEATAEGIYGVEEEYVDFSLSRYPLMMELLKNGIFVGGIEDLKPLDEKLYFKMKSNNVSNVALLAIYNGDSPIGILGISFCFDKAMDTRTVITEMRKTGVQIATLLTPQRKR